MIHSLVSELNHASFLIKKEEKIDIEGDGPQLGEDKMKIKMEFTPEAYQGEVADLWRYCRICACAYDSMIQIYDENGVEMQLEEKINNYLPITVSSDDELSLQMCQSCVDKLNTTHELIVSCLDSNAKFCQYIEARESSTCDDLQPAEEQMAEMPEHADNDLEELAETPKVKKKVVVLKLVHSNSSDLSPSVRIAKALEYLKSKNKVAQFAKADSTVSLDSDEAVVSTSTDKSPMPKSSGHPDTEVDKLQVASIAEFCVFTSGKNGPGGLSNESPRLESKISKALGTVDNGTKQRIVEAVQNIVSKRTDSQGMSLSCSDCRVDFNSQEEMLNHACLKKGLKNPRGNSFACKMCPKKFKEAYKLRIHKQICQQGKLFVCTECGKKFCRKNLLLLHQLLHLDPKPYHCKNCSKRFRFAGSLEVHQVVAHFETKPWCCKVCGKTFFSKNMIRSHTCQPTGKRSQKMSRCEQCHRTFRNTFLLNQHLKTHMEENKDKSLQCPQCPKTFANQEKLKQHEPIHLGVRPYQCGICSIGFIRKGNLTKHYKTHSAEKIITCRVCNATFPSVAGLLNHRKTHSNEEWDQIKKSNSLDSQKNLVGPESYQCSVCNKCLSSKLSLSLHMRVHTGEKPYQCEICNKRFTQKPALTYHMRLHTGERPHSCQYCGKGFNSKVGKESHERIHTGERPYKCGQCGVGFRCSANLRQHTWIHTDNRPFVCEVCSKLFRRREALQVHMRIHTGERPYSCPICGRSFTQKGDMLKHTRSHSKKNVRLSGLACQFCGQVFTRKMHYKIHLEKCSLNKGQLDKQNVEIDQTNIVRREIVTGQDVIVNNGHEEMKAVTISSDDMIPKFSEITIVTNDIQEYEVEYQS